MDTPKHSAIKGIIPSRSVSRLASRELAVLAEVWRACGDHWRILYFKRRKTRTQEDYETTTCPSCHRVAGDGGVRAKKLCEHDIRTLRRIGDIIRTYIEIGSSPVWNRHRRAWCGLRLTLNTARHTELASCCNWRTSLSSPVRPSLPETDAMRPRLSCPNTAADSSNASSGTCYQSELLLAVMALVVLHVVVNAVQLARRKYLWALLLNRYWRLLPLAPNKRSLPSEHLPSIVKGPLDSSLAPGTALPSAGWFGLCCACKTASRTAGDVTHMASISLSPWLQCQLLRKIQADR